MAPRGEAKAIMNTPSCTPSQQVCVHAQVYCCCCYWPAQLVWLPLARLTCAHRVAVWPRLTLVYSRRVVPDYSSLPDIAQQCLVMFGNN